MIHFQACALEFTAAGCTARFADGAKVDSVPHETIHYGTLAHRLGYGDDRMAFCREHDAAHLFLAEQLGFESLLHDVALGRPVAPWRAAQEESLCQCHQAWVRANMRPIIGGIDWDLLKQRFLTLLGEAHAGPRFNFPGNW